MTGSSRQQHLQKLWLKSKSHHWPRCNTFLRKYVPSSTGGPTSYLFVSPQMWREATTIPEASRVHLRGTPPAGKRELFFEIFVLLYAVLVNLMEIMDGIDDENTFLLDVELHSDTDTDISSNYLDYSSDDSCSELSSDEDLSSARIFTEVDVKTPPVPCPRFKFSGIPSVHVQFDGTSDVQQFYETFIDFSLMSKIVEETNKYSKQCIQSSVATQFLKSKFWVETTVEELHVFFALNILQGIVKKPGIDHYWTFDPQNHECQKLVKVWPVLKHLNEKFSETVTPERDVTIDESLMLFKGRLGWKQFIPLKRARFGVKCFMLCESISGYAWSIIIYTGKDTILKPEYSKLCFSSQIFLTMMEPLLHKGYCLTIDNYDSSPELADKLVSC
ncbi:piggyBac transposable element-derived protein 4-like [Argiope bruennichi]|uniref:piggyBac transposable element-derived protein 4-like n=1 Tax=Argiope bruennichi TaxID=94029 RepID=UPI00249462C6|nr:piggyBac transposable element-derived protein 4-like [Argiope bruennichi]